ncbi:MAG: YajQ family cyclic di-GMP-binding protein [Elusimicrobiota bacterium]|jgi:uncharacterized protein YajQ (UPF0234 family)|nr:YajQ family cyclic di-GMP-binding protein [Elusimicrobiota bacterium]
MADFFFDVVSKVDLNLIEEAIAVARKEVANRYDFKDCDPDMQLLGKENIIKLSCADEYKVKALYDVLLTRLSKRGVAVRNFTPQKIEAALGGAAKQDIKIQQGIPAEKAKEMVKLIKDNKLKANASIQGDQLRVSSASKDTLQQVIALLKGKDFGLELQFTNYR